MKNILKKQFLFLFAVLIYVDTKAQDTLTFENIKQFSDYVTIPFKQKYPTLTFFKHRLITPQFNIYDYYKGVETDSVCNALKYLSLVNDLDISNYENDGAINLSYIERAMFREVPKNITPISLSFIEYSDLSDSAIILNAIDFANNRFVDKSPQGFYPFKKNILFASSALNQVLNGVQVNFLFNDSLFLTNLDKKSFGPIMVDFGDGKGFVLLAKGIVKTISYGTTGAKTIRTKLSYKDKIYYSASSVVIAAAAQSDQRSSIKTPPDRVETITATGMTGSTLYGEYGVWYSNCNKTGRIRKPYIISVGFNPGNGKQLVSNGLNPKINMLLNNIVISFPGTPFGWNGDWRGTFYETYNGAFNKDFSPGSTEGADNRNRYLDRLRDEGYDIIICANKNGTDYAQNNANLVKELIKRVNIEKTANGSNFENVVSGYSAGGIATKLALAQMEADYKLNPIRNPHPHTKMWVSFETENQGSNVPLGFQHLVDFQHDHLNLFPSINPANALLTTADVINTVVANLAFDFNNNPTAYELTNYTSAYPGGFPPQRLALLNKFATIPGNLSNGYPEFCRRVGVGQGSAVAVPVPHDPQVTPITLASKLGSVVNGFYATSIPSSCGGSYFVNLPHAEKTTIARWWSSDNPSLPLFEGKTFFDATWTVFPKMCVKFFGCHCIGPYNIFNPVIFRQKTVTAPSNPAFANYDDPPASTLSVHLQLFKNSAYGYYNSPFMGFNSFAKCDSKLHAFAPTVSTLDLRDASSGQPVSNFTSPVSLQLMYQKPGTPTPNKSYGYPYINHPSNHYKITPYDAVFAIGENPGIYPPNGPQKPANQLHVEDPLTDIGNYLARVEVAPKNLFLSNRNLAATQSNYTAEFEARSKIIVGNGIYPQLGNQNYLTPDGDFKVNLQSHAILHAGDSILFLPGTTVDFGARLEAYIKEYPCRDTLD